jgi:hypothetical protein
LELYAWRMVKRLHSANSPLEKLLLCQARFFSGQRALSLCLSEGLPLCQGLAQGRQFLQGFGFQK